MSEPKWRVGRKLGRTLYVGEQCVGMVDTKELAFAIVARMNERIPPPRGWGVWITQAKPRRGQTWPDSYWWQGPDHYGDCLLTKGQAEDIAADMQKKEPTWRYEARRYVRKP